MDRKQIPTQIKTNRQYFQQDLQNLGIPRLFIAGFVGWKCLAAAGCSARAEAAFVDLSTVLT